MSKCKITVLGSSSGMPSPTRFCSSILFQTERANFLVDCGEGTSFSLLRNQVDPELIDSVFISHSHADHLAGLFLLVQMMHLLERTTPLKLYLPEEAMPGVKSFLQTCYLFPEKITPRPNLFPIASGSVLEKDGITIEVYPNRHLAGNAGVINESRYPNRMQSFCFVVHVCEKKIVYSGDIESSDDLAGIVQDADLLITECFHPQLDQLILLMLEKKVKSALLTHIPHELEGKEKEILDKAKRLRFEELRMAHDGLVLNI
jgi:ribonuclease BN (tRNA processing enzyme)